VRSEAGTMAVLPQNWHWTLLALGSALSEAPHDGQANTTWFDMGFRPLAASHSPAYFGAASKNL
jgi:hypothetical protein